MGKWNHINICVMVILAMGFFSIDAKATEPKKQLDQFSGHFTLWIESHGQQIEHSAAVTLEKKTIHHVNVPLEDTRETAKIYLSYLGSRKLRTVIYFCLSESGKCQKAAKQTHTLFKSSSGAFASDVHISLGARNFNFKGKFEGFQKAGSTNTSNQKH
ncbi:MAG: hypothetical protein R3A11_00350 [Bdellovibrionota bacterium]